jgi:hypothetical protein
MIKKIIFFIMILGLIGCANFEEIQKTEPVKSYTVAGVTSKRIANCVWYKIFNADFNAIIIDKHPDYEILISTAGMSRTPIGTIKFKPIDGGTLIESRMSHFYLKSTDSIWRHVMGCIN